MALNHVLAILASAFFVGSALGQTPAQEHAKLFEQVRAMQGLEQGSAHSDALAEALKKSRQRQGNADYTDAFARAREQSQQARGPGKPAGNLLELVKPAPTASANPNEIAEMYRHLKSASNREAGDTLFVFVSTSIPQETLRVIGRSARRYGAVLVLRGVAGGLNGENLTRTLAAMRPAAEEGAEVQIHPDLFRRFNVYAVPTTVLTTQPSEGCSEESLCTEHVAMVGDLPLDYVLERFARRRDALGDQAQDRLRRAR